MAIVELAEMDAVIYRGRQLLHGMKDRFLPIPPREVSSSESIVSVSFAFTHLSCFCVFAQGSGVLGLHWQAPAVLKHLNGQKSAPEVFLSFLT